MRRTRDHLSEALMSLIHEKSYNGIVVKEILARANVGRSTFYSHYRDKDELLESSIRDTIRANRAVSPPRSRRGGDDILSFSLPTLEQIVRFRDASVHSGADRHDASLHPGADGHAIIHERLGHALAELIADDLSRLGHPPRPHGGEMPHKLLAAYLASTFLVVLSWWLGLDEPIPATSADDRFRSLVQPTLTAFLTGDHS